MGKTNALPPRSDGSKNLYSLGSRGRSVSKRRGAMLRVEDGSVVLKGSAGARLFRRGKPPVETTPVAEVGKLLAP